METNVTSDLMSDEEWAFHERFSLLIDAPGRRRPLSYYLVLYGIFWIARIGTQCRDLPEKFGKWSSFYRRCRRRRPARLWQQFMETLNESGLVPDVLQMVDRTVASALHQAAGAKCPGKLGSLECAHAVLHRSLRRPQLHLPYRREYQHELRVAVERAAQGDEAFHEALDKMVLAAEVLRREGFQRHLCTFRLCHIEGRRLHGTVT